MTSVKKPGLRRKNHFVPKALLRQWILPNCNDRINNLRGWSWDQRRQKLQSKDRGIDAFCFQIDLLTTRSRLGLSDALEHEFEAVDTAAAIARDKITTRGVEHLSVQERSNFAYFLMSLEIRRPTHVQRLRSSPELIRNEVNSDQQILEHFRALGIKESPIEFWERQHPDIIFDEQSFERSMNAVATHTATHNNLVAANWFMISLLPADGTFIASDRPVLKSNGYFKPAGDWFWYLPLSPLRALLVTPHERMTITDRRGFRERFNRLIAEQTERYVFSIVNTVTDWLSPILAKRTVLDK